MIEVSSEKRSLDLGETICKRPQKNEMNITVSKKIFEVDWESSLYFPNWRLFRSYFLGPFFLPQFGTVNQIQKSLSPLKQVNDVRLSVEKQNQHNT